MLKAAEWRSWDMWLSWPHELIEDAGVDMLAEMELVVAGRLGGEARCMCAYLSDDGGSTVFLWKLAEDNL